MLKTVIKKDIHKYVVLDANLPKVVPMSGECPLATVSCIIDFLVVFPPRDAIAI